MQHNYTAASKKERKEEIIRKGQAKKEGKGRNIQHLHPNAKSWIKHW